VEKDMSETQWKKLQAIVDALNANPEPIHFKIREAINGARKTIQELKPLTGRVHLKKCRCQA
jgi:23S rRNA-/tRNA-specific pseudouridylate synthase